MKKNYIIPIFVPHLGCKYDCVFCNQKSISGQKQTMTKEKAKKIIEEYIKQIEKSTKNEKENKKNKKNKKNKIQIEIAFFGGSFTDIEESKQIEFLSLAYEYIKQGKVNSIRISTRPDCINKQNLKMLKKYKVKTIELGVQSTNDYILNKAGRGHTYKDVIKASKLIKWYGFTLGYQMMVGLPESTRIDEVNTVKDLIKLKPKMVRIYPVLVVKNTKLEKDFKDEKYIPISLVQAVEISKELVTMFSKKKIEVIRIGLQSTDEISNPENMESEVVAGPYHEAFRQLVESGLWYDVIVEKIKKLNAKVKVVKVTVNPRDVNNVVGHKKENINKLKKTYDVELKIIQDNEIKQGKSEIEILETYE